MACSMSWIDVAKGVEAATTSLGIVGAGGFFLFKALYGFNNVNCSLTVTCERRHKDLNTDFVSATVAIDKGPNTALSLLRGEVRFTPAITPQPAVLDLCRLQTKEDELRRSVVVWDISAPERALFVSPGEKMHFSCVAEVSRFEPCHIEAVLLGRKRLRRVRSWGRTPFLAQWRASALSMPIANAGA